MIKLMTKLVSYSLPLLAATATFALTKAEPPTAPTKSASPLPSLATVQNTDTVISEKVQSELTKSPALSNQAVSAASHNQIVRLEGSVASQTQADTAVAIAKSVPGVKEVKSQLTIKKLSSS